MSQYSFGIATKGFIFKDGKILTIYKTAKEASEDPDPSLRKDQPGGRVEFGEDPNASLVREISEESGLTVDVIEPLNVWHYVKNDFQLVGVNFLCIWKEGEVVLSSEHESYEWLSLDEIRERNWWDYEQFANAFSKYRRYLDSLPQNSD